MQVSALMQSGALTLYRNKVNVVLATQNVVTFMENRKKTLNSKRMATESLFNYFSEHEIQLVKGPHSNKFSSEGRHQLRWGDLETVEVSALKDTGLGLRIYGILCEVDHKWCFVATEYDLEKKQNRADQNKLKKAARIFGGLYDEQK
jgi:hypothetical protein